MKKVVKSVLSIALFLLCTLSLNAQVNFEGSNEYGRINDLTYDVNVQDKVYAVTLGNHLILSEDNGQNWEVIYSFPANGPSIRELRTLGDDSLSFYIQNSAIPSDNTIYIFDIDTQEITNQYTPPVSAGATQEWVNAYSIYEANTDIVLFNQDYKIGSANYSKVYYTVDGGDSWEEVYYNGDYDSVFPNNVAINPNDSQMLYILRGVGPNSVVGGLFVSNDAGATWTEKEAGQAFKSIAFNPEDPNTILLGTASTSSTTVENLYKSIDGGETLEIVPISWDTYFLDPINYIAYDVNDVNNIIVLEGNEIVISSDGGTTWSNYIYTDVPGSYYYGLKASYNPFVTGEIQITTDYYPVISTDGGATVSQLGNPFFHATKVGVSTEGDQHLYYSVQRGLVHKNLTTMEETPYYVEPINFVFSDPAPIYNIDPNIEGRVYMFTAGFSGQNLWVSNEHGANISSIKMTSFDVFYTVTTDPNNSNKVWASYMNNGTMTIDFTDLFNPISSTVAVPAGNPHLSTFINPSDSNNVLIGLGGEIYHTLDAGSSWANVSAGLTLDPLTDSIYDIKQNPFNSNEFIVGTSLGVFKSDDGAQSWTQSYIGINVRKVEYSSVVEGQIAISMPSGEFNQAQIVYTTDNGTEWIEVPFESIENVGSSSMDFVFQENNITTYLATYDLGAITYEVDTTPLAISDFENNENNILVYPNPVASDVNVLLSNGEIPKQIVIYSYTGQLILEVSQKEKINLENLNQGIYFVKVLSSNGKIYIKKIIKE